MKEKMLGIWREFRRWYLIHFRMDYVRKSIAKRKGKCNRCGICCYNMLVRCKELKNDKDCLVHDTEKLPLKCRLYPIDEKDRSREVAKVCGFYW